MSTTVRTLVYSRGTISTGVHGVEFQCERRTGMRLSYGMTFEGLKKLIREKLRLSPHEDVACIVYRMPVNIVPGAGVFYSSLNVAGDDELELMFETHKVLVGQIPTLELYVEVLENSNFVYAPTDRDIPAGNFASSSGYQLEQPAYNYASSSGYHLEQPAYNYASSSGYRPEYDPSYIPPSEFPGGMEYMAGGSMGPSSSQQTVNSDDDGDYIPPDALSSPSEDETLCTSFEGDSNDELDDFAEETDDPTVSTHDGENDATTETTADAIPTQPAGSREYRPQAYNFFNEVNMEAARDPEWVDDMEDDQDLHVGKVFQNKEAFKEAVKIFSIRSGRDFTVYQSNARHEEYRCKEYKKEPHQCEWRIRATVYRYNTHWTVSRLVGPHKCVCPLETQDHRKLDSTVIASQIVDQVKDNPKVAISQIQQMMLTQFGYHVTYRKAWIAKHKALKIVFGDWESSYALFPPFLEAAQRSMLGTVVEIQTKPLDETSVQFSRVFWAFKPCIDSFPHLKPIIQVDGTWLYGKYKQTLLIACSQDGDRKVVPLAFAIVEGETVAAWKFFLSRLRAHVVGWEKQGVCLISDRADGIKEAVADERCGWQPPYGHHVYCLRHIASNVKATFKHKWLKKLVSRIGMIYVTIHKFINATLTVL